MTTAIEYFRIIAKQFAAVPDSEIQVWLDIAGLNANTSCLVGDRGALALALYAAHMLYLDVANSSGEGGRGSIKSEKEGDLARTYGATVGDGTWLGLSPYGTQYSDMLLGCNGGAITTRYGDSPPFLDAYLDTDTLGRYGY